MCLYLINKSWLLFLLLSPKVEITLQDVNDNPPVFPTDMLDLTVEENIGDGSKIMQLTAMDADEVWNCYFFQYWYYTIFTQKIIRFKYPVLANIGFLFSQCKIKSFKQICLGEIALRKIRNTYFILFATADPWDFAVMCWTGIYCMLDGHQRCLKISFLSFLFICHNFCLVPLLIFKKAKHVWGWAASESHRNKSMT